LSTAGCFYVRPVSAPWRGNIRFGCQKGDPAQQKARAVLAEMGEKDVPVGERVMGEGACLRPNFFQAYRCANVLVEDVTFRASPMWQVHPVPSTTVVVRRVKPISHGLNNDGCNPESCRGVLIEGCLFDTGDDCIALRGSDRADLHAQRDRGPGGGRRAAHRSLL